MTQPALLAVENLSTSFDTARCLLRAVDDVLVHFAPRRDLRHRRGKRIRKVRPSQDHHGAATTQRRRAAREQV